MSSLKRLVSDKYGIALQWHTCNRPCLSNSMHTLDCLALHISLPHRLTKYHPRSGDEISATGSDNNPSNTGSERTHNPRAPCFSSIKNTRKVSEVSNVSTVCSRRDIECTVVKERNFMPRSSNASPIQASVRTDRENMRNFSLDAYCKT